MHPCLLTTVALVLCLPVATADEACDCHFPAQMRGEMSIFINEDEENSGTYFDLLQPYYSAFEVDFEVKRVRIWPPDEYFKGNSEYVQDLENNTMYRFILLDDGSRGACTYIKLTEDIRFPHCLPAGWIRTKDLGEEHVFSDSRNAVYTEYYMHANDLCQPIDIYHARRHNTTTEVKTDVEVMGYQLSVSPDFFPDTSGCTEASFDSFIKEDTFEDE